MPPEGTEAVNDLPAETGSPADAGSPIDAPAADTGSPIDAPAAESSVLDIDVPHGIDTFDRQYVEKVRAEAAKWRTQAQELKGTADNNTQYDVFNQYSEEDRTVWTDIATKWLDNPADAAGMMQKIAAGVLGDPNATPEETATAVEVATASQENGGLTEDKVIAIMSAEQARQQEQTKQEQSVEAVFTQLATAGYEKGTPDAFLALYLANNETKGDVPAAIQMMKDRDQKVIDSYIADKRSGAGPSPMLRGGLAAGDAPPEITTLAEADAAAKAFVAGRRRS
jgi:hypothetical protein